MGQDRSKLEAEVNSLRERIRSLEEGRSGPLGLTADLQPELVDALIDQNPHAVGLCDAQGMPTRMNPAMIRMFGPPPDGYCLFDDPHLLTQTTDEQRQALRKGRESLEMELQFNPGALNPKARHVNYWLHTTIFPLCDHEGVVRNYVVMHKDITERRHAEAMLAEAQKALVNRLAEKDDVLQVREEQYRRLIEAIPDVCWSYDLDLVCRFVSPSVTSLLGWQVSDLIGNSLQLSVTPESWQQANALLQQELDKDRAMPGSGGRVRAQMEQRCKDGSPLWTEMSTAFLRDAQGAPIGIIGVTYDIRDRLRSEEARDRQLEFIEELINAVQIPIFVKSKELRWILVNDAYCALMGETQDRIVGKTDAERFPPVEAKRLAEQDRAIFTSGKSLTLEERLIDSYGRERWMVIRKSLGVGPDEEPILIGSAMDITDRKRSEATLREAMQGLERRVGERTRDLQVVNESLRHEIQERKRTEEALIRAERLAAVGTLAGGVAHEFNNIHQVISGWAQWLMSDHVGPEEQMAGLERIYKASLRAASITENLLAFSRARKAQRRLARLTDVVKEILGIVRTEYESEGIAFALDLQDVAHSVMDAGQIGQVFMNLLINARHAMLGREERSMRVSVGQDGQSLFVRVEDTGCGIPPENMPKLFTPFFTTKGEHARGDTPQAAIKGTGLGLSVCQSILADHDGEIQVQSVPGQGTEFIVILPLCANGESEILPAPAVHLQGVRVLVLDDEPDINDVIRRYLQQEGAVVETFTVGPDALRRMAEVRFDIAVIDLQMPVMSGIELLRVFTSISAADRPATIVMTGKMNDSVQDECSDLPVESILRKPFTYETLLSAVGEAWRTRQIR